MLIANRTQSVRNLSILFRSNLLSSSINTDHLQLFQYRYESSSTTIGLAEKLRRAKSGDIDVVFKTDNDDSLLTKQQLVDNEGQPFREIFLKPKRKLKLQQRIEILTGVSQKLNRTMSIRQRLLIRDPRHTEISTDQDWTDVWPAAASFKASVVPFPVRMGAVKWPDRRAPPPKEANLELMKIPNFLHLTPAHIRQHCRAIKKFCTKWPEELRTRDDERVHFPLNISYSTYVHQGPSIRDMRTRIVTVQMPLSAMNLDTHAREKFIRLIGNRYDKETDTMTIVADRCYTRKQNWDYVFFVITALYRESNKIEEWEKFKSRADELTVTFDGSKAEQAVLEILSPQLDNKTLSDDDQSSIVNDQQTESTSQKIMQRANVRQYADTWVKYRNEPETRDLTLEYEKSVRNLLGIPDLDQQRRTLSKSTNET